MKIRDGLVIENLPDGGCLIVDEHGKRSHALRPEAAAVWRALERGAGEVAGIAESTGLGPELVESALSELAEASLVEGVELEPTGSSRREWLARAALVAGLAVGLKMVETIATPSPAEAQSLDDNITR